MPATVIASGPSMRLSNQMHALAQRLLGLCPHTYTPSINSLKSNSTYRNTLGLELRV